jgi:hypothetical protein
MSHLQRLTPGSVVTSIGRVWPLCCKLSMPYFISFQTRISNENSPLFHWKTLILDITDHSGISADSWRKHFNYYVGGLADMPTCTKNAYFVHIFAISKYFTPYNHYCRHNFPYLDFFFFFFFFFQKVLWVYWKKFSGMLMEVQLFWGKVYFPEMLPPQVTAIRAIWEKILELYT